MAKTWRTMQDGAVRPNGKKKFTGANHVSMEGQTVLQDEEFELYNGFSKSGDTTTAPSQSGIASQDINCRCYASREIMTVEEFEKRTDRKLDDKYYTQEAEENLTDIEENTSETVENGEDSGITYMSKSFRPEYSKEVSELNAGNISIKTKSVKNSKFNLVTDVDENKRSKAVRLVEKTWRRFQKHFQMVLNFPK